MPIHTVLIDTPSKGGGAEKLASVSPQKAATAAAFATLTNHLSDVPLAKFTNPPARWKA
jgi:hypothetical protein